MHLIKPYVDPHAPGWQNEYAAPPDSPSSNVPWDTIAPASESFFGKPIEEDNEENQENSDSQDIDNLQNNKNDYRRDLKGGGGSSGGGGRSSSGGRSSGSGRSGGSYGSGRGSSARSYGNRFATRSSPKGSVSSAIKSCISSIKSFPARAAAALGKVYAAPSMLYSIGKGFRTPTGGFYVSRMVLGAWRSGGYYGRPYLWSNNNLLYLFLWDEALEDDDHTRVIINGFDCSTIDLNQDLNTDDSNDELAQIQNICRIWESLSSDDDVANSGPDGIGYLLDEDSDLEINGAPTRYHNIVPKTIICLTVACAAIINVLAQDGAAKIY